MWHEKRRALVFLACLLVAGGLLCPPGWADVAPPPPLSFKNPKRMASAAVELAIPLLFLALVSAGIARMIMLVVRALFGRRSGPPAAPPGIPPQVP